MKLDYVPLLPVQRELHRIPRDLKVDGMPKRFVEYLRTILNRAGNGVELPPLVAINPMAKDHVTALLDALLALDADDIAARAAAEAAGRVADVPGEFKATLVVIDDWMGAWTSRVSHEFDFRFRSGPPPERLPRWTKHFWITGVLWSSEPASERAVREAMLTAVYRLAYTQRHGPARTLRDMLVQEGQVMAMAGCTAPALDPDDIAYTREVLVPYLDADDMRTCIECLFGDEAGRSLGFAPRGLSPWAGLALALHDAATSSPQTAISSKPLPK
jgi:hypothetical protein